MPAILGSNLSTQTDSPAADAFNEETENRSNRPKEGSAGRQRGRKQAKAANPYDYEQKYEEDAYGEELGSNARFWHVLLDEGQVYDAELVDGWRDTLDVLLVFAGLFSAVVTTFVVQSSQALQPDYAQISVSLLAEMLAMQRAWAAGSSVDDVPRSSLALDAVSASALDYWCNGLWYISLSLSMSAALMAVLVKQWILAYNSNVSGTPKQQALARQFRLIGVERWNVPLIVGLLPMLLHISLLLFFVGLSLYVFTLDSAIAWIIVALAIAVYLLYVVANILPMFDSQCPYKTPLSHYGYIGLRYTLNGLFGWVGRIDPDDLPGPSTSTRSLSPIARVRRWGSLALRSGASLIAPLARLLSLSTASTPRTREALAISRNETPLLIECLTWVHATSSNPSAVSITVQAISGLPADVAATRLVHNEMFREVLQRLETVIRTPDNEEMWTTCERLLRSLLFLVVPNRDEVRLFMVTRSCLALVQHRRASAQLQGAVLAFATDADDLHRITGASANDVLPLPFIHVAAPEDLRLHRAVWDRVLPYLSQNADLSRTDAVHLAIYIWQHAESHLETNVKSLLWASDVSKRVADAPPQDVRLDFVFAIHGLLCGKDCTEGSTSEIEEIVQELLPHLLRVALECLATAAKKIDTDTAEPPRWEFHAELHRKELNFLHDISVGLSATSSDAQVEQFVETISKLVKVSFWPLDCRAGLLDFFSTPPYPAVRPLMRDLVYLLNASLNEREWRTERVFRQLFNIVASRPDEAVDVLLEDDIIAALWPQLKLVILAYNRREPGSNRFDGFVRILSTYMWYIVTVLPDEDVAHYFDYLARSDDLAEPDEAPRNHLTWCILLDILAPSDPNDGRSFHAALSELARRMAKSHAADWAGALSSVALHWRFAMPSIQNSIATESGRRRYHELSNELDISGNFAAAEIRLPQWDEQMDEAEATRIEGHETQ
ncbi:uncharacterized protein SCHCODRAFT_02482150 [Schizophyllum commune H4-8]|uniref:uncharacterized protein n=1 Tax=Schizophyllum commune (strain H4-8 / FGSC 9210) TaxID=578458 RepID=UPI00215F9403|nr:uncharacterized protein SCHCODRAFT_02482150 [Schizophyllum commune H4-8]KAI5900692.1 hypothetical protein SCHCODRAFT_02482150 [Schizophyllum commune H4-8]